MEVVVVMVRHPNGNIHLHGVFASMERAQMSAGEDKQKRPHGTGYRLMRAALGQVFQDGVPGETFI